MSLEEKMLWILKLAFQINPPKIKDIGERKTAVFVNYSPHCNLFSVYIFKGGWKSEGVPDEKYEVYTDEVDKASKTLDKVIKRLETIERSEKNV